MLISNQQVIVNEIEINKYSQLLEYVTSSRANRSSVICLFSVVLSGEVHNCIIIIFFLFWGEVNTLLYLASLTNKVARTVYWSHSFFPFYSSFALASKAYLFQIFDLLAPTSAKPTPCCAIRTFKQWIRQQNHKKKQALSVPRLTT